MRVAVVGGGIAGLAAAWELRHDAEVTVFEAEHLGGTILTTEFCGRPVDEGPDAFITRTPEGLQLCAELGLDGELVAPRAGRSMLWWHGRLRPLPEGLVLGVPRQLGALAGAGILSPRGIARATLDLVLPRRRPPQDLTVWDLVADRFGPEVATRLVDPLVGGIHAGRTEELGASEVVPQLVAVAERSRSLLLGLRHAAGPLPRSEGRSGPVSRSEDRSGPVSRSEDRSGPVSRSEGRSGPVSRSEGRSGPAEGPLFLTPRRGLGALVETLVASLRAAGVSFEAVEITGVRPTGTSQVEVAPDPVPFDAAVVATSARQAGILIGGQVARGLAGVTTASVAVVTMAFAAGLEIPPDVNGFLVPRQEGRLMTACSFASRKWPQWAAPGTDLLRVSVGRAGDLRADDLDDETLVSRLVEEVAEALGTLATPSAVRVSRWPDAFPQYSVGHLGRIELAEAALAATLPNVALAGSSYRGSGVPACIASGRRAAWLVLERAVGSVRG